MNTVEPIRDKRDIAAMKKYLREKDEKYYIMFITGINLGLRVNEILKMTIGDVKGRRETTFRQSKTGKEITVAYNTELVREYKEYCKGKSPEEALVPNPYNEYKSITRERAWQVLAEAADAIHIQYNVGTHTMRKTCGYHYYKRTHDIATLQVWFNHSSPDVTLKYIGITADSVRNAMLNFKL